MERCILDKIVVIGHNAHVGDIQHMGDLGITCVGKNTHVPAGFTVGRNAILGVDLRAEDFARYENKIVPHGATVGYNKKKK